MKYNFSLILIFIVIFPIVLVAKEKTVYYKEVKKDEWGDYLYNKRITKNEANKTFHYTITFKTYKRRKIFVEKHYNSYGKITFIAKYYYNKNISNRYIKYEVYFNKNKIVIKQKDSSDKSRGTVKTGRYSKIKYLSYKSNIKKLNKVEEFHSNGQVQIISQYNDRENLYKQEFFTLDGQRELIQYFQYFSEKKVVWKEENYDKDGKYLNTLEYSYDKNGELTNKRTY